jgi:hypothetical protein
MGELTDAQLPPLLQQQQTSETSLVSKGSENGSRFHAIQYMVFRIYAQSNVLFGMSHLKWRSFFWGFCYI